MTYKIPFDLSERADARLITDAFYVVQTMLEASETVISTSRMQRSGRLKHRTINEIGEVIDLLIKAGIAVASPGGILLDPSVTESADLSKAFDVVWELVTALPVSVQSEETKNVDHMPEQEHVDGTPEATPHRAKVIYYDVPFALRTAIASKPQQEQIDIVEPPKPRPKALRVMHDFLYPHANGQLLSFKANQVVTDPLLIARLMDDGAAVIDASMADDGMFRLRCPWCSAMNDEPAPDDGSKIRAMKPTTDFSTVLPLPGLDYGRVFTFYKNDVIDYQPVVDALLKTPYEQNAVPITCDSYIRCVQCRKCYFLAPKAAATT